MCYREHGPHPSWPRCGQPLSGICLRRSDRPCVTTSWLLQVHMHPCETSYRLRPHYQRPAALGADTSVSTFVSTCSTDPPRLVGGMDWRQLHLLRTIADDETNAERCGRMDATECRVMCAPACLQVMCIKVRMQGSDETCERGAWSNYKILQDRRHFFVDTHLPTTNLPYFFWHRLLLQQPQSPCAVSLSQRTTSLDTGQWYIFNTYRLALHTELYRHHTSGRCFLARS